MKKKPIFWYDQQEYIVQYLNTLNRFHKLLEERRKAYRILNKNLNEFYVLNGKFYLDKFGQCWRVVGKHMEKIIFPLVATKSKFLSCINNYNTSRNVLTTDEILADLEKAKASGRPWPITFSLTISEPPLPWVVCPECGKGWNIHNVTDYLKKESVRKEFPAGEFVGKKLKEMWSAYEKKTDFECYIPPDHRVYNPKYIDNTPHPEYPILKINGGGFIPDDMGKTDPEHVLEDGDVVAFWTKECFHKQCLHTYLDGTEQEKFTKVFADAGFQKNEFTPIPNEYEGCQEPDCTKCASWFMVTTEVGVFKVGWRKRVIAITWPEKKELLQVFKNQDVTKSTSGIHACDWNKATEYLKKIREHLISVPV